MILVALPQEIMRMTQTIVVLKRAHFFSIDNDIIDVHAKTIGAIGIAIYAVLARYANRKTGECWPAIARIQRTLNLGRSTVKRYLHRLEAAGLITVEERWDEEGDRTSNRYTLLDPDPTAITQRQEQSDTPVLFDPATATQGGGSATDPPSVLCDAVGESTTNPEPSDPQNQQRETTNDVPSQGQTNRQRTCLHPAAEVHRMADALTICLHCFSVLDSHETSEGSCHGNDAAA
jgi:DNA-binding MarR family transcriptional regulator